MNPRKPGTLTFENISFAINDFSIVDEQGANDRKDDEQTVTDRFSSLSYILHPSSTGAVDELMALIGQGVLELHEDGIPRKTKRWWYYVDVLLLDDMTINWSTKADPNGKFGIDNELRKTLESKWALSELGWKCSGDESIVFQTREFQHWREAFENKLKTRSDDAEGIGRFGI